jgi:hypothetical protein
MNKTIDTITLRNIIVALTTLVFGLLLASIAIYVEKGSWSWPFLVATIGATLLVGGFSTCMNEWIIRKEFLNTVATGTDKIRELVSISRNMERLGLRDVDVDCNTYDFRTLIATANRLTICLNDGRTWLSRNSEHLRERFSQSDKETIFIIMHPDSAALGIQASKVGTTLDALKMKAHESLGILKRLKGKNTKLKVYGHHFYNPQAVYLGDDVAYVTTYFTSSGRREVPLLIFRRAGNHCFFSKLEEDMKQLMTFDSIEIDLATIPEREPIQQAAVAVPPSCVVSR